MQVNILGGHGGVTKEFSATSYLIDETLLIDAGAVATGLEIKDQLKIDNILVSHSHLDHTKDLAFLCDNCFGLKEKPFQVFSHATVKKAIKNHLFNDIIWPDFSVLPNKEKPTIVFNEIRSEEKIKLGEHTILPVHVEHPGDALGFIIERDGIAVLFTQDTRDTERIWEVARGMANLKAIFTEVSFPNSLKKVARLSDHHTPASMKEELKKMPENVPVYLGHLKPNYQEELIKEINELGEKRLNIMSSDNVVYNF